MGKNRFHLATIAGDFKNNILKYRLGVEIDHFCTGSNMDSPQLEEFLGLAKAAIGLSNGSAILHGPFNELHPAAIDPMALDLAYFRFNQAYEVGRTLGINRMVVHSGYLPYVYFKEWHNSRSYEFWTKFMEDKGDFTIYIENVLEEDPYMMEELVSSIGDERVKICLDTGHANCRSQIDTLTWARVLAPYIGHVHLHNNYGLSDSHGAFDQGNMDIRKVIDIIEGKGKEPSYTIECLESDQACQWLLEEGLI